MKTLTLITALVAATPAVADKVTANVTDRFKTVYEDVPYRMNVYWLISLYMVQQLKKVMPLAAPY
jgi:hypothetical protein